MTIKASFWMLSSTTGLAVIKFLCFIFYIGILEPKDFGILSISTALLSIFTIISNFGVSLAIIQKNNLIEETKIAGFQINFITGLILSILFYSFSNILSKAIGIEEAALILKILSINLFISAIGEVSFGELQKNLKFRELSLIITGTYFFTQVVIVLPLIINGYGLKSIAIGLVINELINTIFRIKFAPIPKLRVLPLSAYSELVRFGGKLVTAGFFSKIGIHIDKILIGILLGSESLGIYTVAFQILKIPGKLLGRVFSSVFYSTMCKLQNDEKSFFKLINYSMTCISVFAFLITALIITNVNELFILFNKSDWQEAILPIRIISIALFGFISSKLFESAFTAKAALNELNLRRFMYAVLVSSGILIGYRFGINVVCFLIVLAIYFDLFLIFNLVFKFFENGLGLIVKNISKSLFVSLFSFFILQISNTLIRNYIEDERLILLFSFLIFISFIITIFKYLPNLLGKEFIDTLRILKKIISEKIGNNFPKNIYK